MLTVTLLCVLLAFGVSYSPEVYYVRPTDSPPSDCPHQPCLTLHQYTQTNNFTTGTTLQFLSGNHTLQESVLNLTSVSNVTLKQEFESNSDVNIICTNAVTIRCENVTGLKIEGLTFLFNFIDYKITALELINCHNVLILNTTFQRSGGILNITRAMILEKSTATIRNSVFEGNVGGAIYTQDNSYVIIRGSSFTRNKGLGNGGAVYAQESTLLLDGSTPNHFVHNSDVRKGGAIQCDYNCSLEMRGINIFKGNYVGYTSNGANGGAVSVTHGKLLLSETVIFSNNTASAGGAVHLEYCYTIVDGEVEFTENKANNSGGGMYASHSTVTTTNKGHMRFIDNRAGDSGAALLIRDNRPRESVLSANFQSNNNNVAVVIILEKITFINTNITGNINGALEILWSNVSFCGKTRITDNSQAHQVIYVRDKSNITFSGNTEITRNSGGGIKAKKSVILFKGYTLFDNNSTPYFHHSGALNCQEGKVIFQGKTLFIHNSADGDGGAIYAIATSIYIDGMVNFTLNTASNGGAMYLDDGASLILQNYYTYIYISYNTALKYGGGIYHVDNPTKHQCNKDSDPRNNKDIFPPCFIQTEPFPYSDKYLIVSLNNKAGKDGNLLYGGLIDRCKIEFDFPVVTEKWFLKKIHLQRSTTKETSSKPYKLCM